MAHRFHSLRSGWAWAVRFCLRPRSFHEGRRAPLTFLKGVFGHEKVGYCGGAPRARGSRARRLAHAHAGFTAAAFRIVSVVPVRATEPSTLQGGRECFYRRIALRR